MNKKHLLLNEKAIQNKLVRLAYEIIENNIEEKDIILAGIVDRGYSLAKVLKEKIEKIAPIKIHLVAIEMDKKNPVDSKINTKIDMDNKSILIVDDVANSGRTLLYALHPFLHVIAKKIQIAVLVDRKHKSYPITADFIGHQVSTTLHEHIEVEVKNEKIIAAYLI